MAKTEENLSAAFAGESQANRKYLAFAKAADQEGFPQIARLFRAAAEAETVHAHNHLRVLGGIKSTAENLRAAVEGETYEFTRMYPVFITEAETDGNKKAKRSFAMANAVEEIHARLYRRAQDALAKGDDLSAVPIWVCQVCGNTVEGEPPGTCPVCNSAREMFKRVD